MPANTLGLNSSKSWLGTLCKATASQCSTARATGHSRRLSAAVVVPAQCSQDCRAKCVTVPLMSHRPPWGHSVLSWHPAWPCQTHTWAQTGPCPLHTTSHTAAGSAHGCTVAVSCTAAVLRAATHSYRRCVIPASSKVSTCWLVPHRGCQDRLFCVCVIESVHSQFPSTTWCTWKSHATVMSVSAWSSVRSKADISQPRAFL
jgi:hypothetical protein